MKRIIAVYLSLLGYACLSTSTFGTETTVGGPGSYYSPGDQDFTGSFTLYGGYNIWDGDGATFYWDFSTADNYVNGAAYSYFDTWTIPNLSKNGGDLKIHFLTQQAGFNTGNLTGDWGQGALDATSQIDYSTLRPGYWFNDIVVVTGGGDNITSGDIVLENAPGGAENWTHYVNDNKLSLRFEGSWPLGYSAVPEPSTYIMVSGLFALPLWRAIRRFRKTSVSEPLV